jgi:hypothetical protein
LEISRRGYRAFSKGLGIVVNNTNGIQKNQLIVQYFGEVYPAWYWYDKQDVIKMFLLEIKKKKSAHSSLSTYITENSVPEFYNIMLEKHKDDPLGYDL